MTELFVTNITIKNGDEIEIPVSEVKKGDIFVVKSGESIPVDGTASASLTVRTDNLKLPINDLLEKLRKTDGIISVKII